MTFLRRFHRRRSARLYIAPLLASLVVTPVHAAGDLGIDLARRIADATLAHARKQALRPMCVVVLGSDGGTIMLQREDGIGAGNCKVVEAKAATAFDFRMPTAILATAFGKDAAQTAALSGALNGHFIVIAGGRPIFDANNRFLGAIAAGGDKSDQDDAAVVAGLASVGLFGERRPETNRNDGVKQQ